jgi:hypothetical protein
MLQYGLSMMPGKKSCTLDPGSDSEEDMGMSVFFKANVICGERLNNQA